MNESKYDIFIPVKMYPGIGFRGVSDREFSANNEKAFDLLNWRASFHDAQSGDRYIIVRTNCSEHEARNAIDEIIARLPFVSATLDASLRAISSEVVVGSYDVDISKICLFNAGISPHPHGGSGELTVLTSIEELSQAFSGSTVKQDKLKRAAEVFADVDFEASTTSRMILIATTLELICSRVLRDPEALSLIEDWRKSALQAGRIDLATALDLMKEGSISSAIRQEIETACERAGLEAEETKRISKRTAALYQRRSAAVHRGASVSAEEVAELRHYVRLLLTAKTRRGPFLGVLEGIERDKLR